MYPQTLTPEERVQIETNLAEARSSYHTLTTGLQARVVVDQNGERVEFTAANSARLAQYIRSLELKLAPTCHDALRMVGPASFTF
jgi:hypothetical protein